MILARQVFQAKYGQGDAPVEVLKDLRERLPAERKFRIGQMRAAPSSPS